MKKKSKVWVFILLVLLLVAVVLILIQCRAPQEQQWNSEYIASSDFSTAASGASSMPSTMTSEQGTTIPSSSAAVTQPSSAPVTEPSQGATQPTTPETKPSQPDAEPTKPATSAPADTSQHSFGEWKYEAYTFKWDGADCPSHRKVRSCTKCGYKEYGNTPDHYCAKGSIDHTVTTVKEGTCTTPAKMRSTCKVCGWYVEYDGKKGQCSWVDKEVHLSDYGPYTNELDATVSECSACGQKSVVYHKGQGWSDYNRYYAALNISTGSSATPVIPTNDNFAHVDHPTWQTVKRDFVYDSDGYVKQFTLYWWYNGSRYSQVIKCGKGEVEAWFAQYGLTGGANSGYTIRIYGTEVRPYSVGSSG